MRMHIMYFVRNKYMLSVVLTVPMPVSEIEPSKCILPCVYMFSTCSIMWKRDE